jgi:hypothetical protein
MNYNVLLNEARQQWSQYLVDADISGSSDELLGDPPEASSVAVYIDKSRAITYGNLANVRVTDSGSSSSSCCGSHMPTTAPRNWRVWMCRAELIMD